MLKHEEGIGRLPGLLHHGLLADSAEVAKRKQGKGHGGGQEMELRMKNFLPRVFPVTKFFQDFKN